MVDYLNLPNAQNQRRMADALERIAQKETSQVTDYTNAPGSKVLVAGDRENGFYGFVQPKEFGQIEDNPAGQKDVTASSLALAIGLTSGSSINGDTAWMKFSRKGEIYLVPVKPLRRSVTWNAIYNQGAVYGDGTNGITPPDGRAGKRLSVSASSNAFLIDNPDDGFLRSGAVTAAVGDTLVARGFSNSDNNGEFTVTEISDTAITVTGGTLVDEADAVNASVYAKQKAVSQNRNVTIGGNRYRVQLLKGAARDPLDSYLDSDRGLVGPDSEWNHLILPLHERARLQNWRYSSHAGETDDWGIYLTDADLVTHHTEGLGSYTWCQETSDDTSYRRVLRGTYGASYGGRGSSWLTDTSYGWRPALRLLS